MPAARSKPAIRRAATLIRAARIHTFAHPKRADAVLVANGRVVRAGAFRSLALAAPRGVVRSDLRPAVLTPGLVDSHTHFLYWAMWRALVVDLSDAESLHAVLARLEHAAGKRPRDEWLLASGFDPNRCGGKFPTASDLDAVLPHTPALVRTRDVHSAWLNTAGLRRAGVNDDTPDPPGGRLLRDAGGRLTGVLQENAVDLLPDPIRDLVRDPRPAARRRVDAALRAGQTEAHRVGLVGLHTMDYGESLSHVMRMRGEGWLRLRVAHAIALADMEKAIDIGLRSGLGDEWVRIGGVKVFTDGALGSQTAYMFEPYPGRDDYCGVPVVVGDELRERVHRGAANGLAFWIHAIGDRAVSEAIEALSLAGPAASTPLPHRIEHAQCVRPADIRRMARARIAASIQPCHVLGDIATADRHWPQARKDAYAFRRMRDAGVLLAAGSDAPIESIDPRRSLFAAAMRTDESGKPAGGWFADQRLTVREALETFTRGSAASIGGVMGGGAIEPGAPADFTVWDEDPLSVPAESLLTTPIRGVVIGGDALVGG